MRGLNEKGETEAGTALVKAMPGRGKDPRKGKRRGRRRTPERERERESTLLAQCLSRRIRRSSECVRRGRQRVKGWSPLSGLPT